MKVSISSSGIKQESRREGLGDGVYIEGRDYREAPFEERWDDLYAFIDQGVGPAALTYEAYRDTGFFMRFFRHNQADNIFMTYQLPHQWDPSTAVRPHMHLIPMASGSGVVSMLYAYAWCNERDVLPGASGWTSGSVTASYTPAHQYTHQTLSFGTVVPPSGAFESCVLVFKVERDASVADTYSTNKTGGTGAANVGVLFFDLHYQKIKAGTISEFPEND